MTAKRDAKGSQGQKSDNPLTAEEEKVAQRHVSPRAVVIHEIIREDGELELTRTTGALVLSGLAAGMSMGFSFLGEALLQSTMPDAIWRHAVASIGYSVGFVIVVLGKQQLFTESTLTAVLPLFTKPSLPTLGLTLRLWGIVLTVNLAGTWLFAALLQMKGIFSPEVVSQLDALARMNLHQPFGVMLVRSILSGWLIALMVWILPSAQSARLFTILIITYTVALAQLTHIVAGSASVAYAVLAGFAGPWDYITGFAVPAVFGNTIGGVALVSLLNHGSISAEREGENHAKK